MPEPREPLTEAELDALVELAGAASCGPWSAQDGNGKQPHRVFPLDPDDPGPHAVLPGHSAGLADARYIAAADPATVLRLVEDVRRLRAALVAINDGPCGNVDEGPCYFHAARVARAALASDA